MKKEYQATNYESDLTDKQYDGEKNEGKKTAHCNRYDGKSPVYSRYKGWRIHV